MFVLVLLFWVTVSVVCARLFLPHYVIASLCISALAKYMLMITSTLPS